MQQAEPVAFVLSINVRPECMAQYADSTNKMVWVTCRGFGPDVVDSATKDLPSGAEVFLQSVIRLPY